MLSKTYYIMFYGLVDSSFWTWSLGNWNTYYGWNKVIGCVGKFCFIKKLNEDIIFFLLHEYYQVGSTLV